MTKKSRERKKRIHKQNQNNAYGKRFSDLKFADIYLKLAYCHTPQAEFYHVGAQSKKKFTWQTDQGLQRMSIKGAIQFFSSQQNTKVTCTS